MFEVEMRGAAVRVRRSGHCVAMELEGLYGAPQVVALNRLVARLELEDGPVNGVLLDMRGAHLMLDDRQLAAAVSNLASRGRLSRQPVGMVASGEAAEQLLRFGWWAAWRGYVRGVFGDVEQGAAWVKDRALVAAAVRCAPSLPR